MRDGSRERVPAVIAASMAGTEDGLAEGVVRAMGRTRLRGCAVWVGGCCCWRGTLGGGGSGAVLQRGERKSRVCVAILVLFQLRVEGDGFWIQLREDGFVWELEWEMRSFLLVSLCGPEWLVEKFFINFRKLLPYMPGVTRIKNR